MERGFTFQWGGVFFRWGALFLSGGGGGCPIAGTLVLIRGFEKRL